MSAFQTGGGRLRAYLEFIAAVVYFFLARALAHHEALGLVNEQWIVEQWAPLIEQLVLFFLLLVGYASMGVALDRQSHPLSEQGLPRRPGWPSEAGLGLAVGWTLALVCVLPMLAAGGIAIVLILAPSAWGWLVVDAVFFALAALAEEVAFRGYGFQRLSRAVGPVGAACGYAVFYAIVQAFVPGSSHSSIAVSMAFSLLLSAAYLRTRALWVSWGLNFAWKASRALIFGLAISGDYSHSHVVEGNPMGPFWLTGGGYGLDASWVAFIVLLAALPVLRRLTRELDYQYNVPPEVVSAGVPLNLNAATARHQHEAALDISGFASEARSGAVTPPAVTPNSATQDFVQIQPASAPPPTAGSKPE
jgi:hypothetical protein